MAYIIENPFITHECQRHGIEKAPINTSIYETYGQCNEDLIVSSMLSALCLRQKRDPSTVRYIEIGANHPVQTSSTYLLYRNFNASGVLVEPVPALAERIRKVRPRDTVVECLVTTSHDDTMEFFVHESNELSSVFLDHIARFKTYGGVEKIVERLQCKNLHINDFLAQYGAAEVDYLSIDAEGLDLALVSAIDRKFRPAIIQCEHEMRFQEFSDVLAPAGYTLAAVTDINAIFTRNDLS